MTRARAWTWTLNNYTPEEKEHLIGLANGVEENEVIRYIIFGEEIGEQGTPHMQGFTATKTVKSRKQMLTLLGKRMHLERSRGTAQQNRDYCVKEGNFVEGGDLPSQGTRKDLASVRVAIEEGATEKEIATEFFEQWTRYHQAFRKYRELLATTSSVGKFGLESFPWRVEMPEEKSVIIWGESGIGKTQFALALLPGALMVSHLDDLRKFRAEEHAGIIFDDMDFNHMPRTSQIHLVDMDHDRSIHVRYDVAVIPKYTKKIFTTNNCNGNIFLIDDPAIRRRIEIHHLVKFS